MGLQKRVPLSKVRVLTSQLIIDFKEVSLRLVIFKIRELNKLQK